MLIIIVMHYGIEVEHIVVCFFKFLKGKKKLKINIFLNRTVEWKVVSIMSMIAQTVLN
jgi:hypothetical protein